MKCDFCHEEAAKFSSIVTKGKYYTQVCSNCVASGKRAPNDAAFQRARGQDDNAKEILQPFNRDGTPNADFAYAYPEQATKIMGTEAVKEF